MNLKAELTEDDLKEAVRDYVEKKLGKRPKDVFLSFEKGDSRDPRERDYFSATAK